MSHLELLSQYNDLPLLNSDFGVANSFISSLIIFTTLISMLWFILGTKSGFKTLPLFIVLGLVASIGAGWSGLTIASWSGLYP
ncbi:hypothetical protein NADFUDRAFT_52455 [Nadsonia fulvescens var. elongata DSM 6958]|uniref:Uncharacterized protein n=1 Tax=Nadsonia fulvescens var. elongata DSM 6958 TaxID=857566 RepID=A0A1E3PHE8_9ASCO|nr:hypothetical protein NADFUDRAFT_52455 [Nadsonia fulvescens var. elongata DSM 6958]